MGISCYNWETNLKQNSGVISTAAPDQYTKEARAMANDLLSRVNHHNSSAPLPSKNGGVA